MTVSLAQGTYCDSNQLDPEDPRCAHVILTGHMETVRPGSDEEAFARKALFKRHPEMPSWPTGKDRCIIMVTKTKVTFPPLDYEC
jgi:hypothetical protein